MSTASRNVFLNSMQTMFRSKDLAMVFSLVMIVALLIVPIPSGLVDLMLALSIAISIGIILMTMFIREPMEFSVFPTVLLLITLLRLGINVAIMRQILLNGSAGKIVETFGNLLVGGNYIVGIVLFLILMIVQFVVINSGAGRVAEVAARFTLDAMPGKQLAIDADLNAGLIDENQARQRRRAVESEADFYGAMDGASKFVRGDAIGAGLAVQVPALLVSAAAGLIVTRSTSEDSLGTELFGQLSNAKVLMASAIITALMIVVPGLPKIPFILISIGLGAAAYFVNQLSTKELIAQEEAQLVEQNTAASALEPESPEDMLEMVVVDPIELEIGYSLIPMIDDESQDNLLHRITTIRRQIMSEIGLILPVVRIRDNLRLQPQAYRIKIRGQEVASGELYMDRLLAIPGPEVEGEIPGVKTSEPAFGLPAQWIYESEQGQAELKGYTVVNPFSVLSTHLTEIVRNNGPELLSRQMVQEMLNQIRKKSPASVDGVVPEMISLGEFQAILRNLLRERVPIRDLVGILEVVANNAAVTRDPNILAEAVRQTMANTLSSMYRDENNMLHVFTFSPQVEATLRESLAPAENGPGFHLDAMSAQQIVAKTGEQMENMAKQGFYPLLLCPRELRLAFRRLVEQSLPNLVVLAFSEVSPGTRVKAHGMVSVE